ncbi:galactokinase [Streptomyces sp. NPDC049577]|uniref:galactokinase n=1 Tax=Streptomyces sp. NPDC049577 TaxID=3155153 RepID=UPI003430BC72
MSTQRAVEGFQDTFGTTPAGVWAAPGRVNLIGEHTDYNEGFVMPLALPLLTRVAARPREDGLLRLHSDGVPGGTVELALDGLAPGGVSGWAAYPAGVAWALRTAGHPVGGADLHVHSDVPVGAGLSSSAALEVATAFALAELYDTGLGREELALLAQRAENDFAGVPCGVMDQFAAACCSAGLALHLDTRDLARRQIPFDLAWWGLRLLVVDTRVDHSLGFTEYAARRAACEASAHALGVPALRDIPYEQLPEALEKVPDPALRPLVRHVVTENHRVERVMAVLDAGDPRPVGPVLTEGHLSLRDDFAVSCRELDLVVSAATAAGALGARMTGGGFGGSAIVLVEEGDAERVEEAVRAAFAAAGLAEPRVFPVVPGEGARRVG